MGRAETTDNLYKIGYSSKAEEDCATVDWAMLTRKKNWIHIYYHPPNNNKSRVK
jgi:hypothetical protein